MAYRLQRDESVLAGLKRVVLEEIESAGDHLSGEKKASQDEAIHNSRKSIKKVRALLRLVRGELGEIYRTENKRLRDIAGKLSELRDAAAIVGTLDELEAKFKQEAGSKKLASVRAGLMKRRKDADDAGDVSLVLNEAASALRKAARRVKTWPLETDGYQAIAKGLEKTYRKGQRALELARKDPRAEKCHELRKRVKDHWYHVRLLEGLWTEVMSAYEKSLKDLETWLGNDHNLVVLREKIVAEPDFYGKEKDIDLTLSLIDKYQKELRDNSLSLAERIYEEKPGQFSRRMRKLWKTWQSEPKSLEKLETAEAEPEKKQTSKKPSRARHPHKAAAAR